MPPRHTPLAISMSARVVEAFRGEWAPLEDVFSDPGVAMDFVRHIDPRCGPTVVRVVSTGGDRFDEHEVEGDWLCESGGEPNRLLPSADKYISMMLVSRGPATDRLLETWETSTRARAMLHEAVTFGVARQSAVLAACACARAVSGLVPAAFGARHLELIEAMEAWALMRGPRGDRTEQAGRAAYRLVEGAVALQELLTDDPAAPACAMYAVAAAIQATSMIGVSNGRAAREASTSVADAIRAIELATRAQLEAAGAPTEDRLADVVREHVSTIDLLRAAATWAAS